MYIYNIIHNNNNNNNNKYIYIYIYSRDPPVRRSLPRLFHAFALFGLCCLSIVYGS